MTNPITYALQADPISLHIVRFLLKNKQAMDSAKGIAAWWVDCDEVAVQAALDRLIGCGVLSAYTFKSCTLYGLTANEEIREWLETVFDGQRTGSGNGGSSPHRGAQANPESLTVIHFSNQANERHSEKLVDGSGQRSRPTGR